MSLTTDNSSFALGLDVGKANVHAAVLSTTDAAFLAEKVFTNDAAGHQALVAWLAAVLPPEAPVHACMEATGSYSEPLALFLHPRLARVSVVNPQCIKAFGQITLRRSKTDPADARLIARFCLKEQPAPWRPPTPTQRKLQALSRRLKSLQAQHAAEQHRVGQCLDKDVLADLRAHLLWLKSHQAKIEAQIHRLVAADEQLAAQAALLISIPGIGKKSAALLLAEIPHPDAYASARQLAAHAGLTPRHHQSGTSSRTSTPLCKIGSVRLRSILYFPAMVALRHHPPARAFGQRLRARGKAEMVILCAFMRKLLHVVFGVLKNQQPYDPSLHSTVPSAA
jgi:transposase